MGLNGQDPLTVVRQVRDNTLHDASAQWVGPGTLLGYIHVLANVIEQMFIDQREGLHGGSGEGRGSPGASAP